MTKYKVTITQIGPNGYLLVVSKNNKKIDWDTANSLAEAKRLAQDMVDIAKEESKSNSFQPKVIEEYEL